MLKTNVVENIRFYQSIGVKNVGLIIIYRPDLILTNKSTIEENVAKLGNKLFVDLVNNSIEDLVLVGV